MKTMRTMLSLGRALARAVARCLAVLVILLLALGGALVSRPELFLNTQSVSWAIRKFGTEYGPSWKKLTFEIHSDGLLEKTVTFASTDFCVKNPAVRGCFPVIDVQASFELTLKEWVKPTKISRFVVVSKSLKVDKTAAASSPKKKKAKKGDSRYTDLAALAPAAFGALRIDALNLDFSDLLVITSATSSVRASAKAGFDPSLELPLSVSLDARLRAAGKAERRVKAKLGAASDLFQGKGLSFLRARGTLAGPGPLTATVYARARQQGEGRVALRARVRASSGPMTLDGRFDGVHESERDSLTASFVVAQSSGALRQAKLAPCRLLARRGEKGGYENASLDCGLLLTPAPFDVRVATLPKSIQGQIAGSAFFRNGKGRPFDGKLDVSVGPVVSWYKLSAALKARFAGRLDELPGSLQADHELTAELFARFEDLVKQLSGTEWAVPAPFNALSGPVRLTASSKGRPKDPEQRIAYRLTTGLGGGPQKLEAVVDGEVSAGKGGVVSETTAILDDVALALPYLKIGAPPAVMPDKRISKGAPPPTPLDKPPEKKPSAVRWHALVRTGKPLRLLSNLTQDPVPVMLDLDVDARGPDGDIRVEEFRAKLFKQTAVVDHIALIALPDGAPMGLEGLILYPTPDATVKISLLGSTAKPQLVLESDPPMSQQEIMALLLYGRAPNQLDSDQAASVGNAQSAVANGAFGLASLYLFASTPIDYVGYDPATQTYSMKFRLPGGASLSVGSGLEESRTLSLRKRLASRWVLETQARRSASEGNVFETILQWYERF
jgi:hypothetical protein